VGAIRNKEFPFVTERKLWSRGKERTRRSAGELEPEISSLSETLLAAEKLDLLQRHEDDDVNLYSGQVGFHIPGIDERKSQRTNAVAEVRFKSENLENSGVFLDMSIESDSLEDKMADVRSYFIDAKGVATDFTFDDPVAVEEGSVESKRIEQALEAIQSRLLRKIESERYFIEMRRENLRTRIRWIGGLALASGVIASGVVFGLKTLVWDPNAAAEELRQTYDEQSHQLPGEGVAISSYPFETIPESEFAAIPSFGGSDRDLDNPRIVTISKTDGCVTIEIEVPSGSELFVALPDNSPYTGYHYQATPSESGFQVCLTEPVPESGFDEDIPIAVQLK
jgi:hypothetical protein